MDAAPAPLPDDNVHGAEAPLVFTHRQIQKVIVGVLLCILLAAIDQTVVIPAVPSIAADLNGFGHLAWIVTAYLLTSTVATPIYGKLSDIYGRRALLLPAIVLFVVASMLCGFATSLLQLIVARALQGLGGAGLLSMAQAAIADVVSPRERGRYQGYMAGTWGVASVAGPIIGGWVTDAFSWRWIFWVNLPIGIGAYLLSSSTLKMLPVRRHAAVIDYAGAALLAVSTTLVLLVMSWGGTEYAWSSPVILGMIGLAAVLVVVLVRQQRLAAEPMMPPRLFANAVFSRGVAMAALNSGALFGATFLLPLFFQLLRGADASTSGTLVVPFLVTTSVGAFIGGLIARRLGRVKPLIKAGNTATVIGFVLLALMGIDTPQWLTVIDMVVVGLGIGFVMPCVLVSIQNAADRRDVGAATGAFLFLRSMGGAVGSTLTGVVLAAQFAAAMARLGVPPSVDMGALRGHEGAVLALDPNVLAAARYGVASAFHAGFAACTVLSVISLIVCWSLPDVKLRTTN